MCLPAAAASAGVLFDNGDTVLRWDNTVGYQTTFRLENRNPLLLRDINADDANRNFSPGVVSNRFDLLSQFDLSRGGFGFDASASAWYDFVYHQKNANNSPATFNPVSVPHNEFPTGVQALHGTWAELDNAFLFGNAEISGLPVSFRVGRYTLLWGESLFFPENGIAAGQAPVDENRVIGQPAAYARDVYMPVAQASANVQLPAGFSLEAYYQFEWRRTRVPGVGSYLSVTDYFDAGGERYLFGNGQYLLRVRDRTGSAWGQFGAALRWTTEDLDLGLYALRFNSRDPEIVFRPGTVTALNAVYAQQGYQQTVAASQYGGDLIDPAIVDYRRGLLGTYQMVFPDGIGIFGASASLAFGNSSIAAEISGRTNMPLPGALLIKLPGFDSMAARPGYLSSDTLNGQFSTVTKLGRSRLWDTADVQFEAAASGPMNIANNTIMQTATNGAAVALRGLFDAGYFQVLPEFNVTLTAGAGLAFGGYSHGSNYHESEAKDVEIGATATYRVFWSGSLVFSHFLGSPAQQPLADRDFVTLRIQRNF